MNLGGCGGHANCAPVDRHAASRLRASIGAFSICHYFGLDNDGRWKLNILFDVCFDVRHQIVRVFINARVKFVNVSNRKLRRSLGIALKYFTKSRFANADPSVEQRQYFNVPLGVKR